MGGCSVVGILSTPSLASYPGSFPRLISSFLPRGKGEMSACGNEATPSLTWFSLQTKTGHDKCHSINFLAFSFWGDRGRPWIGHDIYCFTILAQVAHTFLLGTKYSSVFKASFKDNNNQKQYVKCVVYFFSCLCSALLYDNLPWVLVC